MWCIYCRTQYGPEICWNCIRSRVPAEYNRCQGRLSGPHAPFAHPVNGAILHIDGRDIVLTKMSPYTQYEGQPIEEFVFGVLSAEYQYPLKHAIELRCVTKPSAYTFEYLNYCKGYENLVAFSLLKYIRSRQRNLRNKHKYFTNLSFPPLRYRFDYKTYRPIVIEAIKAKVLEREMALI